MKIKLLKAYFLKGSVSIRIVSIRIFQNSPAVRKKKNLKFAAH